MVLFPPGEVLLWDFFQGKVCHMAVFLQGGRLPYGIISGGRGGGGGLGGGGFPCDTGVLLGGNACLGIKQIHDNA